MSEQGETKKLIPEDGYREWCNALGHKNKPSPNNNTINRDASRSTQEGLAYFSSQNPGKENENRSEFALAYDKLIEYFDLHYGLSDGIWFDIEVYLTDRLTEEQMKIAVHKAIITLNHFPSPKQLIELIHGTPEQRGYRQWGKIMERWEDVKGRKRVNGLNFLNEDKSIDETSYTVLTILGFTQSTQWENVYSFRSEFVKTYIVLYEQQ